MKLNYVGFAVLMTVVVAASGFGYLRTCNQNRSDAGSGLSWQLAPTSGKATYDAELAHSRCENFDEEYRTYGAVGGTEKTFPYWQTVSLAEIVGCYGCDSQSVKGWMTSFYRWRGGGIGYLLVDITYNISGNNQPHRFLAFREVGNFVVEGYQKVLDYRWKDGWSHPAWYFTEDGLYIAAWIGELDGQRTYQLTHRVEVDGRPLHPDWEMIFGNAWNK